MSVHSAPQASSTPSRSPLAIRFSGIRKSWGQHQVIKGIDLDIERGQLVALLGPSGCGKSTLLRLLAGLETPDAGQVWIDGQDVTHASPSARGLSMVFQSYALFPHLSVADNIMFGLQVRGVGKGERQERLQEVLALTNLQGLENRKPAQLSGGQRQRVALARAVISGHSICLMDEPLSNLDAKLRHTVRHEIRALQQRLGMTVVYVTHDQTEAMGMADKIVLMQGGQIVQSGTPEQLYACPANAFAAGFIGSPPMMLMTASTLPQTMYTNTLGTTEPPAPDVQIGVRPEHFRLVVPSATELHGTVTGVEFQGAESYIYLQLHNGDDIIVRHPDKTTLAPGERIGVTWHQDDAHGFAGSHGERLPTPPTIIPMVA